MKTLFSGALLAAACVAALATSAHAQQDGAPAKPMTLKVMTFNLRYASDTPPHSWPERLPVTSALLKESAPDIIGTQEGFFRALKDIASDRPEYAWIGLGRGGGSKDEFAAIFYKRDRFEPLEFDHFWLSDTPEVVGSITWGHRVRRMATWVKLREIASGREFFVVNTHYDHESQPAREKSSALLASRIQALKTELPIIVTGDFNADARDNKAYDALLEGANLTDTWYSAKNRIGQNWASFHGYQAPVKDGPHIDWILTRGAVEAESTRVVDFKIGEQYPSDHFPIEATLTLK